MHRPAARIVLVSDDEQLRALLCGLLTAHGYHGVVGVDVQSGLAPETTALAMWDVAIVDTSVSYEGAMRVVRQLKGSSAATIAIVAKRAGAAMSHELAAGTNVSLGKPFDPRELLLVIRGVLEDRDDTVPQGDAPLSVGPITLSTLLNHATIASRQVGLTAVEARILRELMINANRAVTRERLIRSALSRAPSPPDTRTLDTHVSRLRRKIGNDRSGRTPLRTIRSVGYLLVERWEPLE